MTSHTIGADLDEVHGVCLVIQVPLPLPDSGAHQIQIRLSRQICFRRDSGLGLVGLGCGPLKGGRPTGLLAAP